MKDHAEKETQSACYYGDFSTVTLQKEKHFDSCEPHRFADNFEQSLPLSISLPSRLQVKFTPCMFYHPTKIKSSIVTYNKDIPIYIHHA